MKADIAITAGAGAGFFAIEGGTSEGIAWMNEHLTDEQVERPGLAYSDQTSYTQEIAQGATEDGMLVCVDGYRYLDGGLRGEKIEDSPNSGGTEASL